MKIAITGHRPSKLENDYDLTSPLIMKIKEKIQDELRIVTWGFEKPLTLITGMALGIDTLFAKIAIEYNIPFIAAIPFKGQESKWPTKSQEFYRTLLLKSKEIVIVSEGGYSAAKMQIRNEWMVDNSDLLIAVWDGTSGGTGNCVHYAKEKNKPIIQINPKQIIL